MWVTCAHFTHEFYAWEGCCACIAIMYGVGWWWGGVWWWVVVVVGVVVGGGWRWWWRVVVGGGGGGGGGWGWVLSFNVPTVWCCVLISKPPGVFLRFKRRPCLILNTIIQQPLDLFIPFKGIVQVCTCPTPWSISQLIHFDMNMV